jgi:hypothetical protein
MKVLISVVKEEGVVMFSEEEGFGVEKERVQYIECFNLSHLITLVMRLYNLLNRTDVGEMIARMHSNARAYAAEILICLNVLKPEITEEDGESLYELFEHICRDFYIYRGEMRFRKWLLSIPNLFDILLNYKFRGDKHEGDSISNTLSDPFDFISVVSKYGKIPCWKECKEEVYNVMYDVLMSRIENAEKSIPEEEESALKKMNEVVDVIIRILFVDVLSCKEKKSEMFGKEVAEDIEVMVDETHFSELDDVFSQKLVDVCDGVLFLYPLSKENKTAYIMNTATSIFLLHCERPLGKDYWPLFEFATNHLETLIPHAEDMVEDDFNIFSINLDKLKDGVTKIVFSLFLLWLIWENRTLFFACNTIAMLSRILEHKEIVGCLMVLIFKNIYCDNDECSFASSSSSFYPSSSSCFYSSFFSYSSSSSSSSSAAFDLGPFTVLRCCSSFLSVFAKKEDEDKEVDDGEDREKIEGVHSDDKNKKS